MTSEHKFRADRGESLEGSTDSITGLASSGQPGVEADVLAVRLLPVLMHRMNNATQLLSNLHAMGQYMDGGDWLSPHAEDLRNCAEDIHEIGYLLAVVSTANGTNLLLERREVRGVQWMVDAVIDAVRRDGGRMQEPVRPLPEQAPGVLGGWELPWAFGNLLYSSTLGEEATGEEPAPYEWQLLREEQTWVLISSKVPRDHFQSLRPLIEARLPQTQLDICVEGWSWRLPAAWLKG